jgi:hypothetical protein
MRRPAWLGGKRKPALLHPELPAPTGPLREFVYLDEVSVISLIASRRGAVPEAVTRSESARDTAEINSRIAANAAVAKAEIGSKLGAEMTKGVTTVAKSIVQTTFKDLREIESDRLTLTASSDAEPPKVDSLDDIVRLAGTDKGRGWVVAPSSIRRGNPIEVEVELNADPLFRVGTAISEGLVLLGDVRDVAGVSAQEMIEMQRLSQVLERLLTGLVPLRGRLVDYQVVDVRDSELIVHRRLVETHDVRARELTLVGVASRDLFWIDLRRVLFSGARYTVFCRMARPGVQRHWNPVKLAEAMSEIAPNLEDQLQQLVVHIQGAIRSGAHGAEASGSREAMMRKALTFYAQDAAALKDTTASTRELEEAGLLDDTQLAKHVDVETRREAFAAVTDHLRERIDLELSSQQAHDLRWQAVERAGLVEGVEHAEDPDVSAATDPDQRLLEVEPVAIYW